MTTDEIEDLYMGLEALSKSMEQSGRIDEHLNPAAYGVILNAINFVNEHCDLDKDRPPKPRSDIIRLAREAGFSISDGIVTGGVSDLERFATLVAAAEREACAQAAHGHAVQVGDVAWAIAAAIRARAKQERK